MINIYIGIIGLVALAVSAQTFLKIGSARIKNVPLSIKNIIPVTFAIVLNPPIIIGVLLYIVGSILWLVLLSRLDLVFLYPFGSLEYVFVFLVSRFVFHEYIGRNKVIGLMFVMTGIIILSKFG